MSNQWPKTVPRRLVRAYEDREYGPYRADLERLLRDPRRRSTWVQLSRYVQTEDQWLGIWRAISFSKFKSNQAIRLHKRRSDVRDDYAKLADQFAKLANKIENKPLDVLAFHLLEQDTLEALNVPNLLNLEPFQRNAVALRLLPCWPSASELLRGLGKLALTLADDAMNKPQAVTRSRGDIAVRTFVWHLRPQFTDLFGNAMLGSIAKITDVMFQRGKDQETSRGFVQSVQRDV